MKRKTSIFFLRHGEVYNPKQILYGRLPRFGLSLQGRVTIRNTALKLRNEHIEKIYTSPMLRARQTADIIAEIVHIHPRVHPDLNEVRLIFQGISLATYRDQIQPKLYNREMIANGQETIDEIAKRMTHFLKEMLRKDEGKKILAISHGDPILILVAITQKLPFTWAYKKANYLQPGQYVRLDVVNGAYKWNFQNSYGKV